VSQASPAGEAGLAVGGAPAGPASPARAGPRDGLSLASWSRQLLLAMRPKQWIKNLLVFAAPGTAGALGHGHVAAQAAQAALAFCAVSSGTYLLNDSFDRQADRLHPTKRHRPVASGAVSLAEARVAGVGLVGASVAASAVVRGPRLALVVAAYAALSLAYTVALKHLALVDLLAVAGGFVLRAVAGGAATHVPLSGWFLTVAWFGSLYVVAAKRSAEQERLGDGGGAHRVTLASYTRAQLVGLRLGAAAVAMAGSFFWAFHKAAEMGSSGVLVQVSLAPLALAFARYEALVRAGHGGAPEELFLADRLLQAAAVCWLALVAAATYSG
jgi:decaprenyl-phosphate phosphoribosyltransferase